MILENKTLLAKSVILLYRENLVGDTGNSSRELIKELSKEIVVADVTIGFNIEKGIVSGLKNIIEDLMVSSTEGISREDLLQDIKIACDNDMNLCHALTENICSELSEDSLKVSINTLLRQLQLHKREKKVADKFKEASTKINFGRGDIDSLDNYISAWWDDLQPLLNKGDLKDPAVMNSLDFGSSKDQVMEDYTAILEKGGDKRVYRTLFNGINDILQGGYRVQMNVNYGDTHNYKSGYLTTVFSQIARANKPYINVPGKKSALVLISFEDETHSLVKFIFEQLMYSKLRTPIKVEDYSMEEMVDTITDALQANGWRIFIYRVDPNKWVYTDLINFCNRLEQEKDIVIEGLFINYLSQLVNSTQSKGFQGEALVNTYSRIRNWGIGTGKMLLSPHQLSTDAKTMRRGGNDATFIRDVVGKAFTAGSKQLSNELDFELYHHIVTHGKRTYLMTGRGKHRNAPSIISEKEKFVSLEFTDPKMPIWDDRPGDPVIYRIGGGATDDENVELFEL